VTFNDHEGSTKSYAYVKDHDEALGEISFVPFFEDISVDYEAGTSTEVKMHDGSRVFLKKLDEKYNPTDKLAALTLLHETAARGEFARGSSTSSQPAQLHRPLNVVDTPHSMLTRRRRPGRKRSRDRGGSMTLGAGRRPCGEAGRPVRQAGTDGIRQGRPAGERPARLIRLLFLPRRFHLPLASRHGPFLRWPPTDAVFWPRRVELLCLSRQVPPDVVGDGDHVEWAGCPRAELRRGRCAAPPR
jgi:hypothetical protein